MSKSSNSLNIKILTLLLCLASFGLNAQVDRRQNSIPIPAEKVDDSINNDFKIEPERPKNNNIPKEVDGLPIKNPITLNTKPDREFSMMDDSKLMDPGQIFEKRYAKQSVEQGIMVEKMSDQFLGEFKSNGKFVNIVCRDHEYPDGDLVRVFVNGAVYVPTLLLTSGYKGFNIPLTPGANTIEFLALNQGESGPNTAEFQVYDDNKNLVSSKKWNLLTGVKATIVVFKDLAKEE
ncbi:hypothetical protein SAMN03097699_0881 [Flavobacteriaceae bacterium MAR_2010_188]|nr:hypothetical protein SAMN03097699_0881 [Flavobacteriaceae bacterium MAR_2010_188]